MRKKIAIVIMTFALQMIHFCWLLFKAAAKKSQKCGIPRKMKLREQTLYLDSYISASEG